ncbi:AF4/FMR2 family member 4 isoform X2 [Nematostella vectensis]|uniref:AF4/FMR2 family member 4 isoform X2 n=1 Tax=Nematostella vectensis TaxID=45351 RepID=UPI00207723C7|nr:AF4/FMR2 family member 4 isoform X2 [Nematostella vectensis]
MTQSEASANYMGSSFPYSGSNAGLSLQREEEREKARRRRAQQLPRAEADSQPLPLFPQPRKVQTISDDPLQNSVQAALGDFDIISKSMHQKQYLLLGIGQVPQTPVEGKKGFNFEGKKMDKKECTNNLFSKLNAAVKTDKSASKIQTTTNNEKPKAEHKNSLISNQKKSPLNQTIDHLKKSPKKSSHEAKSPTKSTSSHDTKSKSPCKATKESSSKVMSSKEINKESSGTKDLDVKRDAIVPSSSTIVNSSAIKDSSSASKENTSSEANTSKSLSSKQEEKETSSKPKPPKLYIVKGGSMAIGSEEMTQPIPGPPLTGIQTPLKVNSRFAFPHLTVKQKHSPSIHLTNATKNESNGLLDHDLMLSDSDDSDDEQGHHKVPKPHRKTLSSSSGSSSEGSDSDSSDSDSDSSDDENHSLVNSPTKTLADTAKMSNEERAWGLGDLQKAFTAPEPTTKPPTTSTSDPTLSSLSLNTVGGEGLRGNQAAPPPNSKSTLNTNVEGGPLDPIFDLDDGHTLFSGIDLPDFLANGLGDLSHEVPNSLLEDVVKSRTMDNVNTSENKDKAKVDNNNQQSGDKPSKGKDKKDSYSLKKSGDSSRKNGEIEKNLKEKKAKEQEDKASKAAVKKQKAAESASIKHAEKQGLNSEKIVAKKKVESRESLDKKRSKVKSSKTSGKPVHSDTESEEVDVVTVSYDRPLLNRTNSSSSEHEVYVPNNPHKNNNRIKKNQTKTVNGLKEHVNGKLSPIVSPKDEISTGEVTKDENGKPDSLVVKIDLALLKRIPRIPGTDSVVIKLKNAGSPAPGNDSWDYPSPQRGKVSKRHLSIELSDTKKIKQGQETKEDLKDPKKKSSDRKDTLSRHHTEERRGSVGSKADIEDNRRKRSSSRESDRYSSKRRRHDNEQEERSKSKEKLVNGLDRVDGFDNAQETKYNPSNSVGSKHDLSNGVDLKSDIRNGGDQKHDLTNGLDHKSELSNGLDHKHGSQHNKFQCSCSEKPAAKMESWIEKLYQAEPKLTHNPDYYLKEAKRIKHLADGIKDTTVRAHKYLEAVVFFVRCGKALEQTSESECKSYQMYKETIEMLKYAMRLSMNKSEKNTGDKRFLAICMRLQALLYMRLFRLCKDGMLKTSKILMENYKAVPKSAQAPSPYSSSTTKMTGTPSPMSPTPSPSGSIGSVGSVGSTGSNDAITTPSRTSKHASGAMASPVNTTIPQKIHTMTVQHLNYTNHMLYAYDLWEQSQNIFIDYKDFFLELDRTLGPVTLHSSLLHVVEYIDQASKRL